MIRSLYSAASGLVAQSLKQDIIANNIANAQTAGFKRSRGVSETFSATLNKETMRFPDNDRPSYPDSPNSPVLVNTNESIDNSQGPIQITGNTTDLAISGSGYFEVKGTNGTRYTRNGNFNLDNNGYLCTAAGEKVMGDQGEIKVSSANWQVAKDGSVISDGQVVNKIKLTGSDASTTQLLQGSIEGSNVSIIREMVGMISNMRSYEANQKVITSTDETLGKAVSEVGRVS